MFNILSRMSDIEVDEGETEEFNLTKGFEIDNIDNTMIEFLSSSSSENDNSDNGYDIKDYLSQIEDNKELQKWLNKKQKNKNNKRKFNDNNTLLQSNKKRKTLNGNDDIYIINDDDDNNDKNKYNELMEMEESKSGLNIDNIGESQLFREFGTIGLVCNDIPFCYE